MVPWSKEFSLEFRDVNEVQLSTDGFEVSEEFEWCEMIESDVWALDL